mmetsp:Transcript_10602/g.17859  ORF Transcript_10602/g.17859 Transcript_10602/m.17859 type:complete len:170 (-) Transcript_10602:100-609(-)
MHSSQWLPMLLLILLLALIGHRAEGFVVVAPQLTSSKAIIRLRQRRRQHQPLMKMTVLSAKKNDEEDEEKEVNLRKKDIVKAIAEKTGISQKDTDTVVKAFLQSIEEAWAEGNRVSFINFGTFKLMERKARMGRNPKTGESLEIAASLSPTFAASKALRSRINDQLSSR